MQIIVILLFLQKNCPKNWKTVENSFFQIPAVFIDDSVFFLRSSFQIVLNSDCFADSKSVTKTKETLNELLVLLIYRFSIFNSAEECNCRGTHDWGRQAKRNKYNLIFFYFISLIRFCEWNNFIHKHYIF